jgi:hypothetical protein
VVPQQVCAGVHAGVHAPPLELELELEPELELLAELELLLAEVEELALLEELALVDELVELAELALLLAELALLPPDPEELAAPPPAPELALLLKAPDELALDIVELPPLFVAPEELVAVAELAGCPPPAFAELVDPFPPHAPDSATAEHVTQTIHGIRTRDIGPDYERGAWRIKRPSTVTTSCAGCGAALHHHGAVRCARMGGATARRVLPTPRRWRLHVLGVARPPSAQEAAAAAQLT